MLKNWLKIYWYNAMKHKMYFLLTVVGLAIGIASVVLASLYYLEESSYDQWNPNKDEVYIVETVAPNQDMSYQFTPLGRHLKAEYSVLDNYMYFQRDLEIEIVYNNRSVTTEEVIEVQNTFFEFFPYDFVYGNAEKALVDPNDIAIDITIAEKLFGKDVNPLGKEIEVISSFEEGAKKEYIVSGVYEIGNKRSSLSPLVVKNGLTDLVQTGTDWFNFSLNLCVKTKQPEKIKQAISEIRDKYVNAPIAQKRGKTLEQFKREEAFVLFIGDIVLHKLADCRMLPNKYLFPKGSANVQMLNISIYLSIAILLLSIFNYINLSLTQVMNRGKEIGVRRVVGSSKKGFYKQSLFETTIVVVIAFVLAICSIEIILPYIKVYLETNIAFSFINDLAVLIVIALLIILICGSIPAWIVSKFGTIKLLKGTVSGSKGGKRISNGFLVLQFAIACFFIIGSLTVNKQVNYMLNKNLGFKGDQVVNIEFLTQDKFTGKRLSKYTSFKSELQKISGVEGVTTSNVTFIRDRGGAFGTFYNNGKESVMIDNAMIDYNFFDVMQIKLKEGRILSEQLSSDSLDNVVVNEAFVRVMNMNKPIGASVETNGKKMTVVGVIHDFNITGLEEEVRPCVYYFMPETPQSYGMYSQVYIKIHPEDASNIMPKIEQLWKQYNTHDKDVFKYEFVDKQFAETFNKVQMEKRIFNILSFIVVFIALFGLFAVSSYTIGTRLKEIAIRKVLGAETEGLLRQLSIQYVVYCLIGFGIAVFPSYYFLNKWLTNYAYRIDIGWDIYVYSLLLIVVLTLSIVLSRAYRATKIDVLKYIKYE
ncbi:ABC transporter permease [Myroides sp.]|uniref:ABC transporter permease n=1 Tax=Myroides sp. TaxID=1874736 RepID=UPI003F30A916